jgi:hypothetical protein
MTVLTDRAKAVLDNLKGSTFAGARAVEIAEDFINDDTQDNDTTAQLFLDTLANIVKATVRQHNIHKAALANDAAETQAGDDSVTDL